MGIQVLPAHLVNKIAAGEVIERPASVVKELIENAIDSAPTRIDVTVEDGGKKLISVADDGGGMSQDDLALAFAPHATSKLTSEDDLYAITTMGFRGEALASIASVSHAHIRTRRGAEAGGYEISASDESQGAGIEPVRPCAAAPGTTVTVRDLFFNTPARRKFLRTTNTEMSHVTEHFTRLALPHPRIAFTLTHNAREVLNLPAVDTTADRVRDLFGEELAESLLSVAPRGEKVAIAGLIAPPGAGRGSGKWQYFFVNGRYIRDRLLAHALRESFRGLIEPSRFPVAMLFIDVDPAEVDFNVHPTKIEVRFRDGQSVHGELLAALKETLNKANLTVRASVSASVADAGESAGSEEGDEASEQRRESLRKAMADFFKSTPPAQPRFSFPGPPRPGAQTLPHRKPDPQESPITSRSATVTTAPPAATTTEKTEGELAPDAYAPTRRALQIHDSYIVVSVEDGVLIIDQHALHERLIYNNLRDRITEGGLTTQRLLIPETLHVTPAQVGLLEAHAELLDKLGIEAAPFGPASVAVQGFPSMLVQRGVTVSQFVRDVLDKLTEDEAADTERLLEDMLEMMACKAAVKAGDPLTDAEIDSLPSRYETAETASASPHGRPTTLKLTLRDLQKQFKRT